jgi:hypothetical protein
MNLLITYPVTHYVEGETLGTYNSTDYSILTERQLRESAGIWLKSAAVAWTELSETSWMTGLVDVTSFQKW